MASTIKVTNIDTPDSTGNITVDRPLSGSGASLTSLPAGNLTGTVADARISTLTASKLTGALPAISGANLTNLPVASTYHGEVTLSNGASSHTFSSIPTGVTRMRLVFYELSANGNDHLLIQFGDSGGIETSGYQSSSGRIDGSTPSESGSTSGFIIRIGETAGSWTGICEFQLMRSGVIYWAGSHTGMQASSISNTSGGGDKVMYSGPLTDVKIGWTGSNTFTVSGSFVSKLDLIYWKD